MREEKAKLLAHEKRVERDRFGEGHAKDALDKDFSESAGITANRFGSFESDETDANGGTEAAKAALNAASHFSEYCEHDVYLVLVV